MSDTCDNVIFKLEIPTEEEFAEASTHFIPDLPAGPLDVYRKQASFNWKKLKYILEGKEMLQMEHKLYNAFMEDLVFRPLGADASFDEIRKTSFMRTKRLVEYIKILAPGQSFIGYRYINLMTRCVGFIDWSAFIKAMLGNFVFITTVLNTGTERHFPILQEVAKYGLLGCVTTTEIGHGSNLRGLQTTATYDPNTQEFVINTPSIEAAKCWVGNLGKQGSWSLLFAQLYTPNNKCHGLHVFLVPFRDPITHQPFPGITVGDLGPKIGLQGIDNGFMMFHNYRIPRHSLLNKQCDVTVDGKYVTSIKEDNKRFSSYLGSLSFARVGIIGVCTVNMMKALTISIRYSAARKQFGVSLKEESPIIEYQLQQWRLIPSLAAMYALNAFSKRFLSQYQAYSMGMMSKNSEDRDVSNSEMHAISSAIKPLASWLARDTIQESREACGGHGYLKMAGLGDLRGDHDANLTYEGESNILLQQASNYLMHVLKSKEAGETIQSPFGVLNFFNDFEQIIRSSLMVSNLTKIPPSEIALNAYKWLICYLAQESLKKLKENVFSGSDPFTARNNTQVYYLRTLAIAFGEHTVLQNFYEATSIPNLPSDIFNVLNRLCSLYGMWSLEKHLATLYEGGYITGSIPTKFIRSTILKLCNELKNDAVSLVDVFAPPDAILNSPLGAADGNIYQHLYSALVHRPGTFDLPVWWKELQEFPKEVPAHIAAKL